MGGSHLLARCSRFANAFFPPTHALSGGIPPRSPSFLGGLAPQTPLNGSASERLQSSLGHMNPQNIPIPTASIKNRRSPDAAKSNSRPPRLGRNLPPRDPFGNGASIFRNIADKNGIIIRIPRANNQSEAPAPNMSRHRDRRNARIQIRRASEIGLRAVSDIDEMNNSPNGLDHILPFEILGDDIKKNSPSHRHRGNNPNRADDFYETRAFFHFWRFGRHPFGRHPVAVGQEMRKGRVLSERAPSPFSPQARSLRILCDCAVSNPYR